MCHLFVAKLARSSSHINRNCFGRCCWQEEYLLRRGLVAECANEAKVQIMTDGGQFQLVSFLLKLVERSWELAHCSSVEGFADGGLQLS